MKLELILPALNIVCMLAACQTPLSPIKVPVNNEFTLARDQSAKIRGTDMVVTFNSILSDERCPSEVECAASGPVTASISIQQGDDQPSPVTLQTFTDQEGRAPGNEFEGIQDSVEAGDYLIRIVGVLPYPRNLSGIKSSDYQVTLIVIPK
jgi:hypothetical protein